jgi:sugar phosphate permease
VSRTTTSSIQLVSDVSTEDGIFSKITLRLVPFLFLCYLAAYLDRVNVGFAKLQMQKELALSETVYGLGAGIFFLGYVLFEVPSNIILHKVGARLWLAPSCCMGSHLGRNRIRQHADRILRHALLARCG